MAVKASSSYCFDQVRRLDHDRFMTALFAPKNRRDALFALYAFNLEVARIRETVSEPILGQVRLQWWREAIEGVYRGAPPQHQVAEALYEAVATYGLSRSHFDRLLDARAFDLGNEPHADVPALLDYADGTSGSLTVLALEALDPGEAEGPRWAARVTGHMVGIAWATTGLIRAIPFHARQGRIYLPKALMDHRRVQPADVLALKSTPALRAVVGDMVMLSRNQLKSARDNAPSVPDWAIPALLPTVLADSYLDRIEHAGFDPFAPEIEGGRLGRQFKLWRAARAYRY